jgi:hypothetical protein
MPKYISISRLQQAVKRLGESRAQTRFTEFLVLKRGLVLDPAGTVKMGMNDNFFRQAIDDLMRAFPSEPEKTPLVRQPLIKVYGTARTKDLGYVKERYYSNGINSSIGNTDWHNIADIISERPRTVRLKTGYLDYLEGSLLLKNKNLPKPRLDDSAVWFYRSTDISDLLVENESLESNMKRLIEAFCKAVSLTGEEIQILFEPLEPEAGE